VDVYQFNLPFTPTLVYLDSFYVINKILLLNTNINYKLASCFVTNTVWPPNIARVGKYSVSHSLTSPDIATTIDTHYRHIPLHFSHNECTPVQISLQYLHWC